MVEITLDRKEIMSHLVKLLKLLAEAIGWVCHQRKKIIIRVPDAICTNPRDGGCIPQLRETGRIDAEILLGILKRMRAKDHQRPTPKGRN